MEPIDIETIEEADRFAFGLNTEQVNEWREDYEAKHSYFLDLINSSYSYLGNITNDDDLYRLLFVMVISFERSYQSLPEIIGEDYYLCVNKWEAEYKKERRSLSPNYKIKLLTSRHGQPNLAKYLNGKLNQNNDGWNKYPGTFKYIPVFNLMIYCDVMNTAIEKLLSPPTE